MTTKLAYNSKLQYGKKGGGLTGKTYYLKFMDKFVGQLMNCTIADYHRLIPLNPDP